MKITRPSHRRPRQSAAVSASRFAVPALIGGLGVVAFVTGCDTAAFISPQIRDLSAVNSRGAVPAECNYDAAQTDYTVRFTARDTDQSVIEPGSRLVGYTVELGETFSVSDLEIIGNAGRIYPSPDVVCSSPSTSAECDAAGLPGFTCGRLDERNEPLAPGDQVPIVCGKDIVVNIDRNVPITYSPALPEDDVAGGKRTGRSVLLLTFNGSTVLGESYTSPGPIDIAFRTDPGSLRVSGFISLIRRLGDPEQSPFAADDRVEFCFATYREAGPEFRAPGGPGTCFEGINSVDRNSEFRTLEQNIQTLSSQGQSGKVNFWRALDGAIEQFTLSGSEGYDRHVVLYLDGDITTTSIREENGQLGFGYDSVLADALANDVAVHIVQLDRQVPDAVKWGPIDDLQRLACETGGTFIYTERPESLDDAFTNLGFGLPTTYEADLTIADVGLLPIGTYRLATQMGVTMNERTEIFSYGGYTGTGQSRVDRRLNITFERPCSSSDECLTGNVCGDTRCVNPASIVDEGSGT